MPRRAGRWLRMGKGLFSAAGVRGIPGLDVSGRRPDLAREALGSVALSGDCPIGEAQKSPRRSGSKAREVAPEWAAGAAGGGAAERLADGNEERVVFVVQSCAGRQRPHEQNLNGIVAGVRGDQAMTRKDSPGIGVHDEGRDLARVEQNRIRRFRSDAGDGEELLSEARGLPCKHPVEAEPVTGPEVAEEMPEPCGLYVIIPCRPDERGQPVPGERGKPGGREDPRPTEVGKCLRDVRPGGILGQDGADDHLEAGPPRPPSLGPQGRVHAAIERRESMADRGRGLSGCGVHRPGTLPGRRAKVKRKGEQAERGAGHQERGSRGAHG